MTFEIHDDLRLAHLFCCPIVIGKFSIGAFFAPPEKVLVQSGSDSPILRSGTLTFIRHGNDVFGLTCAHVVRALQSEIDTEKQSLLDLCGHPVEHPPEVWPRFFFLRDDTHFDINVHFEFAKQDGFLRVPAQDIAAAWIPPELFSAIGRRAIDIDFNGELDTPWQPSAGALATGYPEANRRIFSSDGKQQLALQNVTLVSPVNAPQGDKIFMRGQLLGNARTDVDVLSGMSGGPIFVTSGDRWGLAAIISDGADINAYAKPAQQTFACAPEINVIGESLNFAELRLWLDAIKGVRSNRETGHVKLMTKTA
jgi:hypothetical protein